MFDKLALSFVSDHMRVLGTERTTRVVTLRFAFDFRFQITPIQLPVWTPVMALPATETPEDTLEQLTHTVLQDAPA